MILKIRFLAVLFFILCVTPITAFSATTNRISKVVAGDDDTTLGQFKDKPADNLANVPILRIYEKDLNDCLEGTSKQAFQLDLTNAEWNFEDTIGKLSDEDTDITNFVKGLADVKVTQLSAKSVIIEGYVDNSFNVEDSTAIVVLMLTELTGEGDATVTIDPMESVLSSGTYKFATVAISSIIITVEDKKPIPVSGTALKNIVIRETHPTSLKQGEIKLKLSEGWEYNLNKENPKISIYPSEYANNIKIDFANSTPEQLTVKITPNIKDKFMSYEAISISLSFFVKCDSDKNNCTITVYGSGVDNTIYKADLTEKYMFASRNKAERYISKTGNTVDDIIITLNENFKYLVERGNIKLVLSDGWKYDFSKSNTFFDVSPFEYQYNFKWNENTNNTNEYIINVNNDFDLEKFTTINFNTFISYDPKKLKTNDKCYMTVYYKDDKINTFPIAIVENNKISATSSGGSSGSSGGGGGSSSIAGSPPVMSVKDTTGKNMSTNCITYSYSDKTATIKAPIGYDIEDVLLNGKSIGIVTEIKDITKKDKIQLVLKPIEQETQQSPNTPVVLETQKPTTPTIHKEHQNSFKDVQQHWASDYISRAIELGLFSGTSNDTFSPDAKITRGMIAAIIYRMSGETFDSDSNFIDVSADDYYSKAVAWGVEKGIINGIGDGKFSPNSELTREQLAVLIYNYAKHSNIDTPKAALNFTDNDSISPWAIDAVSYCVNAGIISGRTDRSFDNKGTATRAETASILVRFIDRN